MQFEDKKHVYTCKTMNEKEENISYTNIYSGNLKNQIVFLNRYVNNFDIKEERNIEI